MEQWEIDLRNRLESELPDRIYTIRNDDKFVLRTGKKGYIDYRIAMRKEMLKLEAYINEVSKN